MGETAAPIGAFVNKNVVNPAARFGASQGLGWVSGRRGSTTSMEADGSIGRKEGTRNKVAGAAETLNEFFFDKKKK
jgi:hypothetical protein